VPFFEQPIRMAEGITSPEAAGHRFNLFLEGMFIPPDVRRLAKWQDTAGDLVVPRERKTASQAFMASVPGLRRKLPVDINAIKRMDISKVAELIENAPAGTFHGSTKTDLYLIMNKKLKAGIKAEAINDKEADHYIKMMDKLGQLDADATLSKSKRTKQWRLDNDVVPMRTPSR